MNFPKLVLEWMWMQFCIEFLVQDYHHIPRKGRKKNPISRCVKGGNSKDRMWVATSSNFPIPGSIKHNLLDAVGISAAGYSTVHNMQDAALYLSLTGLHDPIACSIEGGGVPTQNNGYKGTRLCPLFYLWYFFFRTQKMALVSPLPPPRFTWVPCPPVNSNAIQCNFPAHPLSLPLLPSLRPFVV